MPYTEHHFGSYAPMQDIYDEDVRAEVVTEARNYCDHVGRWPTLARLAGLCRLPSAWAAWYCLEQSGEGELSSTRMNYYRDEARCLRDDSTGYIGPEFECGCGDRDCNDCWPEGYECGCYERDCSDCYPDGYDCDCGDEDCTDCYPDGADQGPPLDDMGDDDDWEGMPDMPVSPPGRCRIGVEVEFNGPHVDRHVLASEITNRGIACLSTGYGHQTQRFWKMTTDATVSGGECVSPILPGDDTSIEQVREVIRLIKAHGGTTGRNVGMHVHLDVTQFRKRQLEALAHNLAACQDALAAFVPDHRWNGGNSYGATLLDDRQWDRIHGWIGSVDIGQRHRSRDNREQSCPVGRYSAFNFNSLLTYGTVEVRLLGHTLNTIKVRTWIRVLQAIVVGSKARDRIPAGADFIDWAMRHGLEPEQATKYREVVEDRGNTSQLIVAA